MSQVAVRRADIGQLARVEPLKRQIHQLHLDARPDLFAPMEDMDAFVAHTAQSGVLLFFPELDGAVVGYALALQVVREANACVRERRFVRVEEICVDAACQRMGIGRALIAAIREEAQRLSFPRVVLDVWSFNEGARQFYESVGFTPFQTFLELPVEDAAQHDIPLHL